MMKPQPLKGRIVDGEVIDQDILIEAIEWLKMISCPELRGIERRPCNNCITCDRINAAFEDVTS